MPIISETKKQLARLKVKIAQPDQWSARNLNSLNKSVMLFANEMGGISGFAKQIGGLTVERSDIGEHLGLAYRGRIQLSSRDSISTWSVIHELAHAWDAKNGWNLSLELEKYTGGLTSPLLSSFRKFIPGQWDAGKNGPEQKPGLYGRKPGANLAGYFYGDKPSGSNWQFNRKEDFAESVVMYCGWGSENELSKTAHGRIERYLLPNGWKDPVYGIADNWSDYAPYFYPQDGDYTKTKRWQFIHDLLVSPRG
jgi:hypothetical protein